MLALQEIFKHDAWKDKGKNQAKKAVLHSNSLNLASDMLQDFILHKLQGGHDPTALQAILGTIEPNGVLKIFTACLSTTKSADTLLVLLEQVKPTVCFLMNRDLLLRLFHNLLKLSLLDYEGLATKEERDRSERTQVIRDSEELLTLVVSWTTFLVSTVKKLNSKNSANGLLYLAQQSEFALILKEILMLALDENKAASAHDPMLASFSPKPSPQSYSRCLAIVGKQSFKDFNNDTHKIVLAINECKEKALTFLKVVWQYLWMLKPSEAFHGENPFVVDAHFFLPIFQ